MRRVRTDTNTVILCFSCQVRAIVRIASNHACPFRLKVVQFNRAYPKTPAGRLVVHKRSVGCVDDAQACFADPQTIIHILKGYSEFMFVKTSQFEKQVALSHHARRCHRTAVADHLGKAEVVARITGKMPEYMGCAFVNTHRHTRMLD